MHEFYQKLETAADICRQLAREAADDVATERMERIVAKIEDIIRLSKEQESFRKAESADLTARTGAAKRGH